MKKVEDVNKEELLEGNNFVDILGMGEHYQVNMLLKELNSAKGEHRTIMYRNLQDYLKTILRKYINNFDNKNYSLEELENLYSNISLLRFNTYLKPDETIESDEFFNIVYKKLFSTLDMIIINSNRIEVLLELKNKVYDSLGKYKELLKPIEEEQNQDIVILIDYIIDSICMCYPELKNKLDKQYFYDVALLKVDEYNKNLKPKKTPYTLEDVICIMTSDIMCECFESLLSKKLLDRLEDNKQLTLYKLFILFDLLNKCDHKFCVDEFIEIINNTIKVTNTSNELKELKELKKALEYYKKYDKAEDDAFNALVEEDIKKEKNKEKNVKK